MNELRISQMQIEDAVATLDDVVDETLASGIAEYEPDAIEVPHPDFALFAVMAEASDITYRNGRYAVAPTQSNVLASFAGLRGFAQTRVRTSSGTKTITGPAIVLPGGSSLAMLTAETSAPSLTDMQHALLDSEYAKHHAKVSAEHQQWDGRNVGGIGAALVVASTVESDPDQDMHGLAAADGQTFGTNFAADGRQDIQVGHEMRFVRSTIIPANRAVLYVGTFDQLPADAQPLGVALSADALAVGMTLAATTSRGQAPDLRANLTDMVEA